MTDRELLESIVVKLDGVTGEIGGLKAEVNGIKTEISGLKSEINGIKTEIAGLHSRMDRLENKTDTLQSQLEENTQITKAIQHRQNETDAKIENMAFNIYKLQGEITEIKDDMYHIRRQVQFSIEKASQNEFEMFKLRREHEEEKEKLKSK